MAAPDTQNRILDIAERLVQTRGFNGFSYADIAEAMQVTKASLHYHFRGKADLGKRLIERYETNFLAALASIDAASADAREKLRRYAAIYGSVLDDDRMCLCGMLAAEFGTLPESMRAEMRHYFDANEKWLVGVLKQGKREKKLTFAGAPAQVAQTLIGSLEGAMMLARSYGDPARFRVMSDRMLSELGA
jgi:TetR/AcrR family transcriptional regulator, transcriptional repressor for nem operon